MSAFISVTSSGWGPRSIIPGGVGGLAGALERGRAHIAEAKIAMITNVKVFRNIAVSSARAALS
jgi:hypothetical protein